MRVRAAFAVFLVVGCKPVEEHSLPPEVELVSAGIEPRHKLRYHAAKSTARTLEVAVDMEVTAGEMESVMPSVVMTLSVVVEDVLYDGRMKLRTTVRDVVAHERIISRVAPASLGAPNQAMKGVVMTSTLYRDGRLVDTAVEGGARYDLAALGSSFEQVMVPLPDEPVGVGAVWRSGRPIQQGGMKLKAVSTITVTAMNGDNVSFVVDTQAFGDDQQVKESGVVMDVKDIVGTGKGTGSIDLATLAMTSAVESQLRSEMTAPGETTATPMKMTMTTKVVAR